MSKAEQKEKYTCDACGLSFETKDELDNHKLVAHQGGASTASRM